MRSIWSLRFSISSNTIICSARRLDRGFNIFTGILKNYYFLVIFMISSSCPHLALASTNQVLPSSVVGGQILIVEFGGSAFQVVRIGGRDWGISIVLGFLSLPIAILVRLLPPGPFERFMIRFHLYPDPNALPTKGAASEDRQWGEGIDKVIDNLNVYSQIRGGRLRSSSIVLKSRSKQLQQHE